MPDPAPGLVWSGPLATFADGDLQAQYFDLRMNDLSSLTIGACTYDMVTTIVRYLSSSDGAMTSTETLFYLPEFGISLFAATRNADETEATVYSFVEIRAARP